MPRLKPKFILIFLSLMEIIKNFLNSWNALLPIRATGGAVGRNHICIIVPCHRVVGVNHNLTGYGGGIDKKIKLLQLEGVDISQFKKP